MLQLQVIGHLGADARVESANGKPFVSFRVAHSGSWTAADGVKHETTTWISCALNGDGGNVLPYLKKGQLVFLQGRPSTRVYSSPKLRQMVAGINLSVDRIELVGAQPDPVPRELITTDGAIIRTAKYWQANRDDMKTAGLATTKEHTLLDTRGRSYHVAKSAWVSPATEQEPTEKTEGYEGF